MRYSLIFLFNKSLDKVLLMFKTKGPYPNTWNGIGGKIEDDECGYDGALREAMEETGVELGGDLRELVTCVFPTGVKLRVFYAVVDENEPRQMEAETIQWFDVYQVIRDFTLPTAGEGNVRYFVEAAINAIRAEASKKRIPHEMSKGK